LVSIKALDYPRHLVRALVVADNCSDETAAVARSLGADVTERRDETRTGKGYALAHGLEHAGGSAHDAVVFVDADCTVSPNLLREFDRALSGGAEVVQAYYTMQPSATSSTRHVRALALALVHRLRPLGAARLGGSAGIKGSGMCFSRAAIERVGWQVFGLAEDIEQHNRVLDAGMRVAFAAGATVTGAAPDTLAAASEQHRRWEAGRVAVARRSALPVIARGLRRGSLPMITSAIELLIPPISIVVAGLLLGAVFAAALGAWAQSAVAAAGLTAMLFYLVAGVIHARMSAHDVLHSLAAAPGYVLWKLGVYVRALIAAPRRWESTRRD
jgi:cellulose synthase/poly-beta-1,6-N-acetylglucosamine synthase-like glycosyltransferase